MNAVALYFTILLIFIDFEGTHAQTLQQQQQQQQSYDNCQPKLLTKCKQQQQHEQFEIFVIHHLAFKTETKLVRSPSPYFS
jgi:hypothetical protein